MVSWPWSKKSPEVSVVDCIWLNRRALEQGLLRQSAESPLLVLAFFESTHARLADVLRAAGPRATVQRVDQLSVVPPGARIVVGERHPLNANNRALVQRVATLAPGAPPVFHSALDDALMMRFSGDRMQPLLAQLGLTEAEPIDHPMLSKALGKASKQIEEKLGADVIHLKPAASMAEWFQKNLPAD